MPYIVTRNLLQSFIILGLTIGLAECGQQQDTPACRGRIGRARCRD